MIKQKIEPEPPPGRPLTYLVDGVRMIGQYVGRAAEPPKHRRGQRPEFTLPAAVTGWVMAADGLALVARISGTWQAVPVPEGMPDPASRLATAHRPAPEIERPVIPW